MEGVGARLGRTSTRYGPTTVFTGPVRKWKKKWVHVAPSTKDNNSNNHSNHSHQIHNHSGATTAATANGTSSNGNNGSHLLLYKWTPITQSQNNTNNNNNNNNNNNSNNVNGGDKSDVAAAPEEPPRRKIRYIPIAVLEEQKNEDAENEAAENIDDDDDDDDDDKQIDIDPNATESTAKVEVLDEKPDINDVPMEENQDNNQLVRQDLNERTLDLSLGLKAHDDDHDPDSKTD